MKRVQAHYGSIVIGLLIVLVSAYKGVSTLVFQRGSQQTEGRIVAADPSSNLYAFTPVVSYRDRSLTPYTVPLSETLGRGTYSPGERIPIRYQTSDPSVARIDIPLLMWDGPVVGLLLGSVIIWTGIPPRRRPYDRET